MTDDKGKKDEKKDRAADDDIEKSDLIKKENEVLSKNDEVLKKSKKNDPPSPNDAAADADPEGPLATTTDVAPIDSTKPVVVNANQVDEAELEANFRQKLKEELVTAEEMTSSTKKEFSSTSPEAEGMSKTTKCVVVAFLLAGIAFASILGVLLPNAKEDDLDNMASTSPDSTDTEPMTRSEKLQTLVASYAGAANLEDETSPQYQAISWLAEEDELELDVFDPANEWDVLERYVMMVLFYSTGGPDTWEDTYLFGSNYSTCEWPNIGQNETNSYTFNEVDCDDNNRIVKVRLDLNGLSGYLPSELALLPAIEIYSFGGNPDLAGTLPTEIGTLSDTLVFWQTAGASLTGTVPTEIAGLTNIEVFSVYQNSLTGSLPDLSGWSNLQALDFAANQLVGSLPVLVPGAPIRDVYLEENSFDGTIPSSYWQAVGTLATLSITNNLLTGAISTEIGNLAETLEFFWADGNQFEGPIPTELGTMRVLTWLWLHGNSGLTGTIPTELGNLRLLSWLDVSSTDLMGTLPTELGQLDQLRFLDVYSNDGLTGTVPMEYTNMGLERFRLHGTSLVGGLEESFCALDSLTTAIRADCGGGEISCSCCTDCCTDPTGNDNQQGEQDNCQVNVVGICETQAGRFELDVERNATCTCLNGGTRLECTDSDCPSCNLAGDVCALNTQYGYTFNTTTGEIESFHNTIEYISGWPDTVLEIDVPNAGECTFWLNGEECRTCGGIVCASGFEGWQVNCDNVDGGGTHNVCEEFVNPGFLEVMSVYDQGKLTGCPLLIERVGI